MPKNFLETSIVMFVLRCIYSWYSHMEYRMDYIYRNSQIYRLPERFFGKIKSCFRQSFLAEITEMKETDYIALDNSQVVQHVIRFYKRWWDKIACRLRPSLTVTLAKDIKKQLIFSPVKTMSIVTVIAIASNLALSLILQRQISPWGWLMRGLFLFVGLAGLLCKVGWTTIRENSIILRKMGSK